MTGTTISNATTVGLVLTTIGQNPVTITAGGNVYSASSSGIYAGAGVAWNVTNYGLVQTGSGDAPAIDFSTDAVGVTLTNAGTIEAQPGNTAVAFGSGDDLLVIDPGAEFVGYVDGGAGNNTLALASAASNGTLYGLSSKYTDFQSVTVAAGAYWNFNIIDVVGAGVVLTNAGTINVAAGSYLKLAGGTLTNQSTGVINAYEIYGRLGPASSIVNVGLIASELGIFLKANDTVTNLGTILAHTTGYEQGYVVFADYGATVVNGASGNTTAVMSGDAGIRVSSIGSSVNSTITNFGTVIATGANQRAIQLDNGTITNGDPTDTAASLLGSGAGVYVGAVTIINYGTISASGTAGVHATQSAAYIYNLGSSALIEGYVGILASYGTITNAGTIASSQGTAGVAVQFAQAGDRLIIEPGATFVGTVAAVGIAGNTLELTSAATGGTLTGLGSSYLDFQSVTVVAGAYWSFTNDTVAVGVVLSNAGTINVPVASNDYIAGGTLINQATGVIIGQGIYTALCDASSIDNIGLISNQYGIWLGGTDTVTNLGTIQANAGNNRVIYGEFGGTIINGANGVTTALIEGAYGIEFGTGISTNYAVSVANYGTVTGTGINAGALEIQEQAVISNGASGDTVAQLRGGDWGVSF